MHLKSVSMDDRDTLPESFPYNVPVIRALDSLTFDADVTFFVGENGSGKSTLLEAIACAAQLPAIGSANVDADPTLALLRQLSDRMKWVWSKRVRRGFFLRAEDFFGFARWVDQTKAELRDNLAQVDEEYADRGDYVRGLARMPYMRELHALREAYGEGLDAQSHGESYFKLFQARFVPDGLYLLDEPEAPLSPMRQLSLMALLKAMIDQQAQFIIATHSPILLAYPGARIYNFDGGVIQPVDYDDLEHVTLTRDFLNNPQAFLKHLLE
ncbi:MAG: AAA family ATPase [Anaerolineae bacterium]|nr:AAA family ATPase [Anaerolineae bacterium]